MAFQHKVQQGECISSIAFQYGFFPDTVWLHPDNAELRVKRSAPNVLREGDVVSVPDKREKRVDAQTGRRHSFRRCGVPEIFRIQLRSGDQPRAHVRYELWVDGQCHAGQTDTRGRLECPIAPGATHARLVLQNGREVHEIRLGWLDPVEADDGVRARLVNLGYLTDVDDDVAYRSALRDFQRAHSLEPTSPPDASTREKLREVYGS